MDYAGMTEGATLRLPVAEPGALLFIGDRHTRQRDGEVAGNGLEISMDVEFSVEPDQEQTDSLAPAREGRLHHGARQRAAVASSPSAGPRRAVALADDRLGYDERAATLLMGNLMEYEIANVVDPHFTVVAKMKKQYLKKAKQ